MQVMYSTPQFQRKLEAPIRALNHTALNKDANMVPLWKSLTLMWPCDCKDFQEDAKACGCVEYDEKDGSFICTLHAACPSGHP